MAKTIQNQSLFIIFDLNIFIRDKIMFYVIYFDC